MLFTANSLTFPHIAETMWLWTTEHFDRCSKKKEHFDHPNSLKVVSVFAREKTTNYFLYIIFTVNHSSIIIFFATDFIIPLLWYYISLNSENKCYFICYVEKLFQAIHLLEVSWQWIWKECLLCLFLSPCEISYYSYEYISNRIMICWKYLNR